MIGLHEGQGSSTKKTPERVFTLHLSVVGTKPLVWRRLLVRESMWLSRLHDSIQIAFDWFDYQTHAFNLDDLRFGNPLKRDELTIEDDRDVTLADLDL
ncbi:MAG TPA: plasmid pRiA4b ORF-3 family protein, partial [Opitutus sp.]|nr:plasmid pRiA4b ORF-3 family protein [Opitutus sp.]